MFREWWARTRHKWPVGCFPSTPVPSSCLRVVYTKPALGLLPQSITATGQLLLPQQCLEQIRPDKTMFVQAESRWNASRAAQRAPKQLGDDIRRSGGWGAVSALPGLLGVEGTLSTISHIMGKHLTSSHTLSLSLLWQGVISLGIERG